MHAVHFYTFEFLVNAWKSAVYLQLIFSQSLHQTHRPLFQTLKESTKIYITLIYPRNSKSNSF